MRSFVAALTALCCCLMLSSVADAQMKPKELEAKVKNLEGDIEVLQEFIQEQSAAIKELKEKLAQQEKMKQELEKLSQQVNGNTQQTKKVEETVVTVSKKVATDSTRVDAIQEELSKKKVEFFGQYRLRPEFDMNYSHFNNLLSEDRNFSVSHRARLGIDITPWNVFSGRFTLQDARVWGSPTLYMQREEAAGDDRDSSSAMKIQEAFINLSLAKEMINLRLGRQAWEFGAGRMIGQNDWLQSARSFDGFDMTIAVKKYLRADLLWSWIDERNAIEGFDKQLGGIYLTCPYVSGMAFDLYYFYLHDVRDEALRKIHTLGLRIGGAIPRHKQLFFDIEGAIQFGRATEGFPNDNETVENRHYAVFLHTDLGYAIKVKTTPTLTFFFELASGDGNTSPKDKGNDLSAGWMPLFPNAREGFGKMGMWKQNNIWDIGGTFSLWPIEDKLRLNLELHSLHLYSDTGAVPNGEEKATLLEGTSKNLGFEFDIDLTWQIKENLEFSAGYSLFAPGDALKERAELDPYVLEEEEGGEMKSYIYPVGDPAHWLFFQLDYTF